MKMKKLLLLVCAVMLMTCVCGVPAYAASGDVAGAIEGTWDTASQQIKTVVDNVVFPAIDLILAVFFLRSLEPHTLIIGNMDSLNGRLPLSCSPV